MTPVAGIEDYKTTLTSQGLAWTDEPHPCSNLGKDLALTDVPLRVLPETGEQVATTLRIAADQGRCLAPVGGGTGWCAGTPPARVDALLDLDRLSAIHEHSREDFVVRVGAGCRFHALQEFLRESGQHLPIEPPCPNQATVGGLIGSAARSLREGSDGNLRRHLLGVRVAHGDGTLTTAGGRVVKNVSGYDLMKLYHGSMGSLAVLVEATFRVRPLPAADRFLLVQLAHDVDLEPLLPPLLDLPQSPAALLFRQHPGETRSSLMIRFRGGESAVQQQLDQCSKLLGGVEFEVHDTDTGQSIVESFRAVLERGQDSRTVQFSVHYRANQRAPSWQTLSRFEAPGTPIASRMTDLLQRVTWCKYVAESDGDPAGVAWESSLDELENALARVEARLVLQSGPADLRRRSFRLGVDSATTALMEGLKTALDPQGVLPSGIWGAS